MTTTSDKPTNSRPTKTRSTTPQISTVANLLPPTRREWGPKRWGWAIDEDRYWRQAESYFNQMAAQGWQLVKASGGRWGFAPCQPGQFIYRVLLLDAPVLSPAAQDYLRFLADAEIEILTVRAGSFAIVRRAAALGPLALMESTPGRLAAAHAMTKRCTLRLVVAFVWPFILVPMILVSWPGPDRTTLQIVGFWLWVVLGVPTAVGWPARAVRDWRRCDRRMAALIANSAIEQ
jgi:hypothetical protein